jgi:hypothetical protein
VNTFENPKAIVPQQERPQQDRPQQNRTGAPGGNVAVHRFAPASVTRLTIETA